MAYFDKQGNQITVAAWTKNMNSSRYKISKRFRNAKISMVVWFNGEAKLDTPREERELWSLTVQTPQPRPDLNGHIHWVMDDDKELSGTFKTEQEAINVYEHLLATTGQATFVVNKETGASAILTTNNTIKEDTPDDEGLDPAKAEEYGSW